MATTDDPLATVLGKTVAVLQAFEASDPTLTLAELRRRTGIARSTLHRLLADLVGVGLLDKVAESYRLSQLVFELGMLASIQRRLIEVATPFMHDLYARTQATVHLGVQDGVEVVYVFKVTGHRSRPLPSRIGGRMPLYCTAVGKALLAFSPPELTEQVIEQGLERVGPRTITAPGLLRRQLATIRQSGLAFEAEESAVGVTCVAAPILDAAMLPAAALSVTGTTSSFKPEAHAGAVAAAAAGISEGLGRLRRLGL